ncbi:MAG: hypothetical protein KF849_01665 [Rhizobiaceae bacterium]|nr:hypothetical protein [Rhizobiaceae bacterium]
MVNAAGGTEFVNYYIASTQTPAWVSFYDFRRRVFLWLEVEIGLRQRKPHALAATGGPKVMWKWAMLAIVVAGGGYVAYDYYMAGYHTRPAMPEGAFSLSYKNGLRGILVGIPNEKETRRYLGVPLEVPFYLTDAWSWCHRPTEEEAPRVAQFMAERDWPGQRFEAVCRITVDGKDVVRGLIISVPDV